MRKIFLLALSLCLSTSVAVAADENIFGDSDDIFDEQPQQITAENKEQSVLSSYLDSKLPSIVARNIKKQEKVFCYTVEFADPSYEGYMVDEMAIKGSCGELSKEGKQLIADSILSNASLFSNSDANCNVKPRILLRYVNGIDHTDILLSHPCPAVMFFNGRHFVSLNANPGANTIENIIKAYESLNEKFLSPALLGQMVGNGQVITQDQKEIVRRLSPTEAPIKKWNTEPQVEEKPQNNTNAKATGWNKLK
ncbi:MAG: hypothetical protein J6Y91_05280 [Alphaproteobacteria bacterium]|nr:hypothetical protein [Alphaproteobacteria bacterium]